jgi:O-antigen ligase
VNASATAYAAALTLAALWLLPTLFPFAERPVLHFYREWLAGALGLAACALWLLSRPERAFVPRTAVLLVALGAFVLLQAPLVDAPYWTPALGYAAYLGWAALLVVAAAGIRDRISPERLIGLIAWAALLGGVLGAGAGLMQCFGRPDWMAVLVAYAPPGSIRGNLQHQSYFADQMLLGMVCAAFLFAERRLSAAMLICCLVLMAMALALCASRAALLALPLLLALAIAIGLRERSQHAMRLVAALGLAGLAFAACEVTVPPLLRILPASAAQRSVLSRWLTETDEGGLEPRRVLWSKSLEIFAAHPVAGVGPDGFPWHFYRALEGATSLPYTIHSHSLVTQSLVCFGAAGTAIVVALLAAWAWQYRDRVLAPQWWPVTAMLIVLFLRALLDLNFWFAHLLALAAVLLGLGDAKGWSWRGPRARVALGFPLVLAALLLVVTLHHYRQMAALWNERPESVDRKLAEARRNPFFTPLVDSILADGMRVDVRGDLGQLALNSRSMHWRPTPRMVWRQAALLAVNGHDREACRLLVRARRIYPRHEKAFRVWLDRTGVASPASITALRGRLDALARGAPEEIVCAGLAPSR